MDPELPALEVEIRDATGSDRDGVLALFAAHLESLGATPDRELDLDMEDFPRAYSGPAARFLVATAGRRVMAMGGLLNGEIRRVYVDENHRRKGLAVRIVQALAAGQEERSLCALVADGNVRARGLFTRCGFSPSNERPSHPKQSACRFWFTAPRSPSKSTLEE